VQWHPERGFEQDKPSQAIFLAFVKAAAEWHRSLSRRQQDFESVQTLAPVSFEHALAAALETPPERKPKKKANGKAAKRVSRSTRK
jgi:hypothetical protein